MKKPTKAHATRIVYSNKNYPEKLRLLFWNLGTWIVHNDPKLLVLSRNEERMLHADLMNNPTHAPKLRKMMAAHAAFLPYWNVPHGAVLNLGLQAALLEKQGIILASFMQQDILISRIVDSVPTEAKEAVEAAAMKMREGIDFLSFSRIAAALEEVVEAGESAKGLITLNALYYEHCLPVEPYIADLKEQEQECRVLWQNSQNNLKEIQQLAALIPMELITEEEQAAFKRIESTTMVDFDAIPTPAILTKEYVEGFAKNQHIY